MAEYRLKALLDIRERAEEDAKQVFASAMAQVAEEKRVLKELEDELERMIQDRLQRREDYSNKLASGEMKITDQSAAYRFIDRLKEREQEQRGRIDAQQEQVREAEKALKRAQDALVEATQDLKALLKHKENWEAERKKIRKQREADQLDEIAQTIYQQRRKGN